jgi:hypothetical protein
MTISLTETFMQLGNHVPEVRIGDFSGPLPPAALGQPHKDTGDLLKMLDMTRETRTGKPSRFGRGKQEYAQPTKAAIPINAYLGMSHEIKTEMSAWRRSWNRGVQTDVGRYAGVMDRVERIFFTKDLRIIGGGARVMSLRDWSAYYPIEPVQG